MNRLINADVKTLMDQGPATAETYFFECKRILEKSQMEFNVKDVIELSKVAAMDFHTGVQGKILENGLDELSSALMEIANEVSKRHGKVQ